MHEILHGPACRAMAKGEGRVLKSSLNNNKINNTTKILIIIIITIRIILIAQY